MKQSVVLVLLLGLWIGGSVAVLGVVGYSFPGIQRAIESNAKLRERVEFDVHDDSPKGKAAMKESRLWVLVGELNRHYFAGFNRAQLFLAVLSLAFAGLQGRRGVLILVALATVITAVLSLYLAGQITDLGRALDFVPRHPEPPEVGEFMTLHRVYTGLEAAKTVFLVVAVLLTLRRSKSENR